MCAINAITAPASLQQYDNPGTTKSETQNNRKSTIELRKIGKKVTSNKRKTALVGVESETPVCALMKEKAVKLKRNTQKGRNSSAKKTFQNLAFFESWPESSEISSTVLLL